MLDTKLIKVNLQHFAEGEIVDTPPTEDVDTGEIDTNVEETGDQQPEIDTTPGEQSANKDNPANHAFAEMRRANKALEMKVKEFEQRQKDKDAYYANLAAQAGRPEIKTEAEYNKAVRLETLSREYQETGDPMKLVELFKETGVNQPVQQDNHIIDVDKMLTQEVEEFNEKFKQNLKTYADIPNLPNYEKIVGYMQSKDLSLVEAYTLANPDKIVAASKQAAINQIKGHGHVTGNNNGGNIEPSTVTAAEVANWKRFFPGKTDAQCRKEIIASKKLFED